MPVSWFCTRAEGADGGNAALGEIAVSHAVIMAGREQIGLDRHALGAGMAA